MEISVFILHFLIIIFIYLTFPKINKSTVSRNRSKKLAICDVHTCAQFCPSVMSDAGGCHNENSTNRIFSHTVHYLFVGIVQAR